MATMRIGFLKGLLHGLAWSLATAAAVTLSWWGVHTVMAGTAYDPPRAIPLARGDAPRDTTPDASSTHHPEPTVSPTPGPTTSSEALPPTSASSSSSSSSSSSQSTSSTAGPGPGRSSATPSPSESDEVEDGVIRGYDTKGGRVVLDIGKKEASLVSASPRSGWAMQVSKSSHEIRVVFTTDGAGVSFVCEWHGGKQPQVVISDI